MSILKDGGFVMPLEAKCCVSPLLSGLRWLNSAEITAGILDIHCGAQH